MLMNCGIFQPEERAFALRRPSLPPVPQEPKYNAGLKELHELVQVVRRECLAAAERHECSLTKLSEQQEIIKDQVLANLASLAETPKEPSCPKDAGQESGESASGQEEQPKEEGERALAAPKEDKAQQKRGANDNAPGGVAVQVDFGVQLPRRHEQPQIGLQWLVRSKRFELTMGALICLNVFLMFLELEKAGDAHAVVLHLRDDIGAWNDLDPILDGVEHFFNLVFFLEVILRFAADGHASIRSIAVWFDTFIVITSLVDYLFKFVLTSSGGANLNFLRMARMIKLVKLVRAFKAAAAFHELRILIKTLLNSMLALTWSVVLLSFIMLFSGLVMAQLVSEYIDDPAGDLERRLWVFRHYGSGARAFYTLFEATLSGGWPNYARDLIEEVSTWYAIFWIFYVLLVVFAVMRVVSALFLQNTLKMASADDEMMHLEKMQKKNAYISKLKAFLESSDKDGSGTMDRHELEGVLARPDIITWLGNIGLEEPEVMGLFHVLGGDEEGEITHSDLLDGMMKLSGGVRAIDSVLMQRDMKRIISVLEGINNHPHFAKKN